MGRKSREKAKKREEKAKEPKDDEDNDDEPPELVDAPPEVVVAPTAGGTSNTGGGGGGGGATAAATAADTSDDDDSDGPPELIDGPPELVDGPPDLVDGPLLSTNGTNGVGGNGVAPAKRSLGELLTKGDDPTYPFTRYVKTNAAMLLEGSRERLHTDADVSNLLAAAWRDLSITEKSAWGGALRTCLNNLFSGGCRCSHPHSLTQTGYLHPRYEKQTLLIFSLLLLHGLTRHR
jgi:hypothetical protein